MSYHGRNGRGLHRPVRNKFCGGAIGIYWFPKIQVPKYVCSYLRCAPILSSAFVLCFDGFSRRLRPFKCGGARVTSISYTTCRVIHRRLCCAWFLLQLRLKPRESKAKLHDVKRCSLFVRPMCPLNRGCTIFNPRERVRAGLLPDLQERLRPWYGK